MTTRVYHETPEQHAERIARLKEQAMRGMKVRASFREPEASPNDLDACRGIMFAALLGFICWSFIIVLCLSAWSHR